jgi:putative hydrolase of the HAD superfamily
MEKIKAIIFDLYGTLIYNNNMNIYSKIIKNLSTSKENIKKLRKIALTENFNTLEEYIKRINPQSKKELGDYKKKLKQEINSTKIYPETISTLDFLYEQKIKLGLISNLSSPYKKPFFTLCLERYFDVVVFSCDVGYKKPDKEIYENCIENLKILPKKTLMVGDNPLLDVKIPKEKIGINALYLNRKENPNADIYSLRGLPRYL